MKSKVYTVILEKTPSDYEMDLYRWTLDAVKVLIAKKWYIELQKSRIQVILKEKLGLCYQKFRRDCVNADVNNKNRPYRQMYDRVRV